MHAFAHRRHLAMPHFSWGSVSGPFRHWMLVVLLAVAAVLGVFVLPCV